MRVLWFTNTPSLYKAEEKGYNGGGWISSLQTHILENDNIDLGVSFFCADDSWKVIDGKTTYYPISLYKSLWHKLKHNIFYSRYDKKEVKTIMAIIDDFKPDVIHIFGSEKSYGLITEKINIPVIIHIQGILNPYLNAWYAPGSSSLDYFRFNSLWQYLNQMKTLKNFKHNVKREEIILKNCKNFMGRTKWDRDITNLYSPDSTYFNCNEILRKEFYLSPPWKYKKSKTLILVSTISKVDYKGFDLILKTANLMKNSCRISFKWKVYGVKEYSYWERKLKIVAKNVDVEFMGVATAQSIIDQMLDASLYVHTSYIDNSPNSVCEAQLLGLPVIATNVGGLESLIDNHNTGLLVPANDPHTLAMKIILLYNNKQTSKYLGASARLVAQDRHQVNKIVAQNLNIYGELIRSKHVAQVL